MKSAIVAVSLFIYVAAYAQSPAEKQLFDLVNKERQKAKLGKLEWSDKLAEAALAHSKLLDQHQDLSHQFAGEATVQQRVGATGLRFNSVAENVAEAPEVETAHTGLMNSPGHRANILNGNYNAVGIAIVQHGSQLFVTEDFAHVPAAQTEQQFQDAVVNKVKRERRAGRLPALEIVGDPQMHKAACSQDLNTSKMIRGMPGATALVIFSQSDPALLPDDLRQAVVDRNLARMRIGVCMETGGANGFTHFWVVAAFYPRTESDK
jgi:uncharacterized protein YkwD